ncbi:MAG: DNA polymerase III subunit alpha [Gammaproteobacteria bacterium]|nr:DNA polymerase III subunit alpha [Gammaproteobacteria bacterium]
MSEFVHLAVHSEYSVVDSVVFLDKLVPQVKDLGMSSIALTDRGNLTAMLKFQNECFKHGVKPIFGCELALLGAHGKTKLVVLATDQIGYHNLMRLVTNASRNSRSQRCADYEMLAEFNEGLILLSGGVRGDLGQRLLAGEYESTKNLLDWYEKHFSERFYAEISRTGRFDENDYIDAIVPLAAAKNVPLVATNDVICVSERDFSLHDAKLCIQRSEHMGESYSWKGEYSPFQHLRSSDEMVEQFRDLPDAIENTVEISKRCNVKVETGTYFQRPYPKPTEDENNAILRTTVEEALEEFLTNEHSEIDASDFETYRERAAYELDVIIEMGFAGYFMIVRDIVLWAKEHDIPVGPGRGSGAASLVAMLLGITGLNPIKHNLFFERLLNRDRRSMPDLDIDFCAHRRDEVMWHVVEQFGRECVGLIATQGTLAAKGIVHGMGRALAYSHSDVSRITQLIPTKPGTKLKEACAEDARIEETAAAYGCTELLEESKKLEGIIATSGVHPAGVVIGPDRLEEYVPCELDKDTNLLVTQLDKDDVEKAGMVKFDLLSLKNLTVIDKTIRSINARSQNGSPPLDIADIPLDDRKTFRLIAAADTEGVFQLESPGMKRLIRQLRPDKFDDIVALVALYRPGPLNAGVDKSYALRKRGQEQISYDHPFLEDVLKNTFGLMIYQEDVMSVSRALAGFSGGEADILREAMGKKIRDKLVELKDRFADGCREKGVEPLVADAIYEKMLGFSEYAFPKAHSTAYAVVTYQTAYLKANYPNEYMAAVVSVERGDPNRVRRLLAEADRMGLALESPDVNRPTFDCVPTMDGLRVGMPCLKGVGEGDVRVMAQAREAGEFTSLFDFCTRIDVSKMHRNTVERLIRSGAFDSIEPLANEREVVRAVLLDKLDLAYQAGTDGAQSSRSLFGGPQEQEVFVNYKVPEPLSKKELYDSESETIGFAVSDSSTRSYFREFDTICTCSLDEAHASEGNGEIVVAGKIKRSEVREHPTRGEIATLELEGQKGALSVILWPDQYRKFSRYVVDDEFVVARGRMRYDKFRDENQLSVSSLFDPVGARKHYQAYVALRFENDEARALLTPEKLRQFEGVFKNSERKEGRPVEIAIQKDGATLKVGLGKGFRKLPVTDSVLTELRDIFGPSVVYVGFQKGAT